MEDFQEKEIAIKGIAKIANKKNIARRAKIAIKRKKCIKKNKK